MSRIRELGIRILYMYCKVVKSLAQEYGARFTLGVFRSDDILERAVGRPV